VVGDADREDPVLDEMSVEHSSRKVLGVLLLFAGAIVGIVACISAAAGAYSIAIGTWRGMHAGGVVLFLYAVILGIPSIGAVLLGRKLYGKPIGIWLAFKAFISLICLLYAGILATIPIGDSAYAGMWGLLAALVFCAAAPWIDFERPSRATGLAGVVMTLVILISAVNIASGDYAYPRECRWVNPLCPLENFLYSIGGYLAAAMPRFLFACAGFYGSYVVITRARTIGKIHAR